MIIDDLPIVWSESNKSSIIKVMGIGGGGVNAVTYMHEKGIHNVNFVVCNTDPQSLDTSSVPVKIQMGDLGAGGDPVEGRRAAMDSLDKISEELRNGTRMVFLTTGMGGGTGTGATPVIARVAKELGLLTVAIVTVPFNFEGPDKRKKALDGISELKEHVDALLIINNDKLFDLYTDLDIDEAFSKANDVLTTAAKGIAELITRTGKINIDFKDVYNIMSGGGITVMGSATASGENRAREAVEAAINSPLLNNNDITGARRVLLNITSGIGEYKTKIREVDEITSIVNRSTNKDATMKWGVGHDEALGDQICVTVVATDFPDPSFLDPTWEIGNEHIPPPKIELATSSDNPDTNETTYGKQRVVMQGNYLVREKQSQVQTEMHWKHSETDTAIAEPSYQSMESLRTVPDILVEGADIDELENIPAYKRKQLKKKDSVQSAIEKEMSKYTISTDKDYTFRLRDNNSYVDDVAD